MHLGVALALLVLCRTRRGNERRIHGTALLQQQALTAQQIIDSRQDAIGQLVFFQAVAKPQNSALVGQPPTGVELGKLAVQRHVKEGFLHRRVRQAAPLLQKMRAQHCLQLKRWPAGAPFGVVRRNERDQRGPGDNALHLRQKLALAGFLHTEIEVQGGLFHALYLPRPDSCHSYQRRSYAEFPQANQLKFSFFFISIINAAKKFEDTQTNNHNRPKNCCYEGRKKTII